MSGERKQVDGANPQKMNGSQVDGANPQKYETNPKNQVSFTGDRIKRSV